MQAFNLLSDTELTDNIKSNNFVGDSLAELQTRHSGIFHQKINGYTGVMEVRDLKENPISFFYEVAKSYNPEKAKFSTWVGQNAFWTCNGYLKKSNRGVELDDNLVGEIPHLGEKELYDYILNNIQDTEDKEIFEKRLSGMTNKQVGDSMEGQYSGEWIRLCFNRIIERYRKILAEEVR